MERRLLAGPRAPRPDDVARPFVSSASSGDSHPHAQPRGQPRDVVQRLDDVGRPGRAGLVVGRVGDRDPADVVRGTAGSRAGRTPSRSPPASATAGPARSPGSTAARSRRTGRPAGPGDPRRRPTRRTRRRRAGRSTPSSSRTGWDPSSGSPGHQTVTGRSWMSSGATSAEQVPARLAAGGQEDQLRAGLRRVGARQHAVGLDPRVDPRRPVRVGALDDQRPRRVAAGEPADGLGAALADLRLAGDDDQVHHRRPGGDVAPALDAVVRLDRQVRLRPDARQLALDPLDRLCPATSSAASARRVAAARPGRSARRPPVACRRRSPRRTTAWGPSSGLAAVGAVAVQIRRHRRPSRASRSSAASGPQVPAS